MERDNSAIVKKGWTKRRMHGTSGMQVQDLHLNGVHMGSVYPNAHSGGHDSFITDNSRGGIGIPLGKHRTIGDAKVAIENHPNTRAALGETVPGDRVAAGGAPITKSAIDSQNKYKDSLRKKIASGEISDKMPDKYNKSSAAGQTMKSSPGVKPPSRTLAANKHAGNARDYSDDNTPARRKAIAIANRSYKRAQKGGK